MCECACTPRQRGLWPERSAVTASWRDHCLGRALLTVPPSPYPFVCVFAARCSLRASGTGASCIFPLLGAASYGWNFVATEIDPESVASARSNVDANQLQGKVSRVGASGKTAEEGMVVSSQSSRFKLV